jgi:hypothetical protein
VVKGTPDHTNAAEVGGISHHDALNPMINDLPLFNHSVAAHNGTDTSREAAEAIKGDLGRLQRLVLKTVAEAPDGLTCKEVEQITGLSHQTASARLNELANCQPPFVEHRMEEGGERYRRRATGPRSSGRIYFATDAAQGLR